MRAGTVVVIYTLVMVAAALWCLLRPAAHCLRRARASAGAAPLSAPELVSAGRRDTSPPRHWPHPGAATDRRVLAGYRDYARERADALTLWAELGLLASGAALGASVPMVLRGGWGVAPATGFLLTGLLSAAVRHLRVRRWTALAEQYARRVRDLAP